MTPMQKKEQQSSEIAVSRTLTEFMSKIGFNVQFSDVYPNQKNPDFIAQKRINGTEYKIAIELKSNSNINDAIKNGIKTLTNINSATNYDKLLLLLLNRNNPNIQSLPLRNFLTNNPTNLEIINLEDLEKWSKDLSDELSPIEQNEVFFYVKQMSRKFIELVAKNPEYLRDLEWRDLERTISELFEGIGFKTTLTPSSKDGGKDVILECTINNIQKTFIVEIKHWRSGQKVGQSAVKEFTHVIINEKREKGLFLSTYGFTGNYYESISEKQKSIIRFGEKDKIVELCKTYEKVNNGIWNPIDSLENILFDNTISLK
ncbi:restriction endonuclease [Flavobacterium sp. GN10]|uniref:Restriction endonuclease n=1 Tax=Flavobacterium tagetis TaxID=2801336 RepID=A0ABS1KDK7_9FLAO|nr:restriction endonuclease [Flavobacterium tagetis]MBL0737292.1 restriction endonuclease [Flavobacterium tagetis]